MTDVDAVIIGSGAGGLTAALALAQAGHKVLVVEQHYLPGGWCHSFTLEGYRFSPGVHYLGELEPGGRLRAAYEGLGVADDLPFCELNPKGFDHIMVENGGRLERFDIPKGKEALGERLKARFPAEQRGIDGYLNAVDRIADELNLMFDIKGPKDLLTLPFKAPTMTRWGLRSTAAFMDHYVKDPLLKAILAGQSGDHGLPPSQCPAGVHASVVAHYFGGGFYPKGGGYAIPRAFIRALRRHGGEIKVKTPVSKILVEGSGSSKRAIGVRLGDGTEVRARWVISNADPAITFGRLVGKEHLSWLLRAKLARTAYSVSAVSLFMAVDMDVRRAGLDSGNYWYYTSPDVEGIYKKGLTAWGPEQKEIPGLFLTCTTLKDPSKQHAGQLHGHHTMEAFAFVGYDAYKRWADSQFGNRPEDYKAYKDELLKKMLRAAGRVVPGLEERVVFAEIGTPLTNEHYVALTGGNLYGTSKTAGQIGPFGYPVKTEFKDLWLCGASTIGHGVLGATLSGVQVARSILKCRTRDLYRSTGQSIKIVPADDPGSWLPKKHERPVPMTAEAEVAAAMGL